MFNFISIFTALATILLCYGEQLPLIVNDFRAAYLSIVKHTNLVEVHKPDLIIQNQSNQGEENKPHSENKNNLKVNVQGVIKSNNSDIKVENVDAPNQISSDGNYTYFPANSTISTNNFKIDMIPGGRISNDGLIDIQFPTDYNYTPIAKIQSNNKLFDVKLNASLIASNNNSVVNYSDQGLKTIQGFKIDDNASIEVGLDKSDKCYIVGDNSNVCLPIHYTVNDFISFLIIIVILMLLCTLLLPRFLLYKNGTSANNRRIFLDLISLYIKHSPRLLFLLEDIDRVTEDNIERWKEEIDTLNELLKEKNLFQNRNSKLIVTCSGDDIGYKGNNNPIPHIFTQDEICRFFDSSVITVLTPSGAINTITNSFDTYKSCIISICEWLCSDNVECTDVIELINKLKAVELTSNDPTDEKSGYRGLKAVINNKWSSVFKN